MDNEEYDEEYRLDDDVMFMAPPWFQELPGVKSQYIGDVPISGYDYIFLRQNGLTWEDRIK